MAPRLEIKKKSSFPSQKNWVHSLRLTFLFDRKPSRTWILEGCFEWCVCCGAHCLQLLCRAYWPPTLCKMIELLHHYSKNMNITWFGINKCLKKSTFHMVYSVDVSCIWSKFSFFNFECVIVHFWSFKGNVTITLVFLIIQVEKFYPLVVAQLPNITQFNSFSYCHQSVKMIKQQFVHARLLFYWSNDNVISYYSIQFMVFVTWI